MATSKMDSTTTHAAHTAEDTPCNSRIKPTRAPDTEPSIRERWNNGVAGVKGYPTSNPVFFPKGPPPPPGADLLAILQGTDSEESGEELLVALASTTAVPRESPQEPDPDFDLDQPVGDGAYQPTWNELVLACLSPPLKAAPTPVPPAVEETDSLPEHPESEPGTPAADPVLDDPMGGTSDEGFMPLLDSDLHSIDIVCGYQFALHQEADNNNLMHRHKYWDRLGLHGHAYDASTKYPDSGEFAALLEAHGLILLNGWVRQRLQPTFVGAKHKSVIDFVITRRQHADSLARRAKPCPEHNFSPWRMGGRHYAVVTSLPLHPGWTRQSSRSPLPQLKYNKQELDQEAREGGPRMLQLRHNLQKYIAQHEAPTLEQVNDFLLQQVITAFPHKSASPAPRAWQTQLVQGSVTAMWQARARLRQVQQRHCRALRACMEAFKRHREFMKAYKQLKLNGRQARKTLLNRELQNAAEAAHRLRDADEHRTIVRHFEELFQSRTVAISFPTTPAVPPQVAVKDVALALRSTQYGKAVPETSAPSSVVKYCADDLAQGCTLAPLLWLVFSAYMTSRIALQLPAEWVQEHLTLYADDTHASFDTDSIADIKFAFRAIQIIFEVYKSHGMKVNPNKSGIVLGVRGHAAREFLQQHIQGKDEDSCLVLGIGPSTLKIPIKKSMLYLGVCVSYGNFELETLEHRLKAAQATRCRLAKVLSARKYLTLAQRLHLYVLCVRSAALYGLGPVGFTSASLRKLQIFETKHIRAIARSPVHLSRESTTALYARLQLKPAAQQLLKILKGLPVYKKLLALPVVNTSARLKICEFIMPPPTSGPYNLDPQDLHCKQKLHNWHNFRLHIVASCPVLHAGLSGNSSELALRDTAELETSVPALQSAAGPELPVEMETFVPIAERADFLRLIDTSEWKHALWLEGVREQLRNHCILCAQWVSSAPGALNKHMFSLHPEIVRYKPDAVAHSLTLRDGQQRPCGACGARSFQPLHCLLVAMDTQSGAEALAQVQNMFPHLAPSTTAGDAPMDSAPLTGRREREEDKAEAPTEPQDKYRRPAGKGQNLCTGKSPPRETTQEPASASAGQTKQGRTRQWSDQEWADWQAQTTQAGWNKNKTTKELQKELEALKEDVRLLSRIAMRHEDELSQRRTETDFILTLEVADPKATQAQEGILEQLYKQEEGKANSSLRLTLFIGLLLYYEIKVQEATASAESVENLAQQGLLIQVEGNPAWTYRQWDHQQALIRSDQPPLLDTELRGHLQRGSLHAWRQLQELLMPDASKELDSARAAKYRSAVGIGMYVSQDRSDIAFTVRVLAQNLKAPTERGWQFAQRLAGYLVGTAGYASKVHAKGDRASILEPPDAEECLDGVRLEVFCDADWSGNKQTRRSMSSSSFFLNSCCVYTSCKSQRCVSLSSAESEFYALVSAACDGVYLKRVLEYLLELPVDLLMRTDNSSCRQISLKQGVSKIRHLDGRFLWIQEKTADRTLRVQPVDGRRNPSDLGTKVPCSGSRLRALLCMHDFVCCAGDCIEEVGRAEHDALLEQLQRERETQRVRRLVCKTLKSNGMQSFSTAMMVMMLSLVQGAESSGTRREVGVQTDDDARWAQSLAVLVICTCAILLALKSLSLGRLWTTEGNEDDITLNVSNASTSTEEVYEQGTDGWWNWVPLTFTCSLSAFCLAIMMCLRRVRAALHAAEQENERLSRLIAEMNYDRIAWGEYHEAKDRTRERTLPMPEPNRAIFIDGDAARGSNDVIQHVPELHVYCTLRRGKSYHKSRNCTCLNNADEIVKLGIATARERGYKPCGSCFGGSKKQK
ncbi:unnamed protein product [Symbiodinium sp. CCMP2592]|nr:unnamed protein product [Symbiodinium sp. CCMP2592]